MPGPTERSRRTLLPICSLALALISACAYNNTKFSAQWKDQMYARRPIQSAFVIAEAKDVTIRRVWEDRFVQELRNHGVTATPSYQLFPDSLPTTQEARDSIGGRYDAILDLRLSGIEEDVTFTGAAYAPYSGYYGPYSGYRAYSGYYMSPYWGYYGSYDPFYGGYYDVVPVVSIESTLWDGRSDEAKLIWSGTTETWDPKKGRKFAKEVARKVTGALRNERLVP